MGAFRCNNKRYRANAGYRIVDGAIVNAYGPSYTWPFVLGYLSIAAIFVVLWYWQAEANQ